MKKFLIYCAFMLSTIVINVQAQTNLILNPGFEDGAIPTTNGAFITSATPTYWSIGYSSYAYGSPDLFDSRSALCEIKIPANKWGNRDVRTAGTFRYAGFSGSCTTSNPDRYYSETIMGTLSQPLVADCPYKISAWVSAIDGYSMNCYSGTNPQTPCPDNKIEAVLRIAGSPTQEKVIPLDGYVTVKAWQNYSATFILTATEAANGYNRIEFRLAKSVACTGSNIIYLDDVDLHSESAVMQTDFSLNDHYCYGQQIPLVSANNLYPVNHQWYIYESDYHGTQIGTQTLLNSTSSFTLNTNTLTANKYYTIKHGCWWGCTGWTETRHTFYLSGNPVAVAGADRTICNGSSTTIGGGKTDPNSTYYWSSGILNNGHLSAVTVTPTATTTYTLTVTNQYGCSSTDAVTVFVENPVEIQINISGNTLCSNQITLTASSNNNGTNYIWNNGTTGTTNIINNPPSPTNYWVSVTNSCGTRTKTVLINPNLVLTGAFPTQDFLWPYSFNPYANTNPIWSITHLNHTNPCYNAYYYYFTVHDRWGGLIYHNAGITLTGFNNNQIQWNGYATNSTNWPMDGEHTNSTAGELVPIGIYVWNLWLTNCSNSMVHVFEDQSLAVAPGKGIINQNTDYNLFNELKIYPNPTKDYFEISGITEEIKSIEVYDAIGKLVISQKGITNLNNINVSSLQQGIYYIRTNTEKSTYTHKLIKE